MKLKTIASMFKQNKRLTIHTAENGEQWISNSAAMYSISGMPHMNPEIILRIFDVPTDKHNDWICDEKDMPETLDFSDNTDSENDIEPLKIHVEWFGNKYWLFPDGRKIYTVKEDYIKPLLDEYDYLTFHKRETSGGGFVLALKIGLELKAIVIPTHLHTNDEYINGINQMSFLYRSMSLESIVDAMKEIYKTEPQEQTDSENEDIESNGIIDV